MNITVMERGECHELPFTPGDTILDVLQREGFHDIHAPCGGKGTCRKCIVNVHSQELSGACLACTTKAAEGMSVELSPTVRVSFADDTGTACYAPTPGQTGFAIAADIGTTTIVCCLLSLETGAVLASVSGSNEQSMYGANVLARLQAAAEGHAAALHEIVIEQMDRYIHSLCAGVSIDPAAIQFMAVSGNTIMEHLFAGLDPSAGGIAPFRPQSLFGETLEGAQLGLCIQAPVYLCPAVSGFIGGDTTAAMLSCGLPEADRPMLMADIGANCELVLGSREGFVACSADAGGAFKSSLNDCGMTASAGAIDRVDWDGSHLQLHVLGEQRALGICGSGMIDALGIMLRLGVLDEMGHIAEPDEVASEVAPLLGEVDGKPAFFLTENHRQYVSQADISRFQLSKAAICAGISILAEEQSLRVRDIDSVAMVGGFGSFAKVSSSASIGLIPAELMSRSRSMGNAALRGAMAAAVSTQARELLSGVREKLRCIDLPTHPSFGDAYVDGMLFDTEE